MVEKSIIWELLPSSETSSPRCGCDLVSKVILMVSEIKYNVYQGVVPGSQRC